MFKCQNLFLYHVPAFIQVSAYCMSTGNILPGQTMIYSQKDRQEILHIN